METATLAAPATQVYEKTAKEAHAENATFAAENNLQMVAIIGNTFPIRGVLYALGGKWSKDAKAWMVPAHRAAEAQALAEKYAPKSKAEKPVVAKVKVAKPVAVKVPAKVETVPNGGNLINRTEVAQRMIGRLIKDVEAVQGTDPLIKEALVSLMAGHVCLIRANKALQGETV